MRNETRPGLDAGRAIALLCVASIGLAFAQPARAQGSICGCESLPSLGAFDSRNAATWVASGATMSGSTMRFPLPADGVLIFDSLYIDRLANNAIVFTVEFVATPDRPVPPVTMLVAGDVTIGVNTTIDVGGETGGSGQGTIAGGSGGAPGPGGFRGGDGAYQQIRPGAARGGAGFGPLGGAPGPADPIDDGVSGGFGAGRELLPLIGGSGGGGGASATTALNCSGGGGGGGGGAILIAANQTVALNGTISSVGGRAGNRSGAVACSSNGGVGAGGAVRVVADRVVGSGTISVYGGSFLLEDSGRVRIEGNEVTFAAANVSPAGVASFDIAPGPVVNPIQPTVRIATVNGTPPPEPPLGALGRVDVRVETPGPVPVEIATSEVPVGTTVEFRAKPRVGGESLVQTATLDAGGCDGDGSCTVVVTPDLAAGSYVLEARATFATP